MILDKAKTGRNLAEPLNPAAPGNFDRASVARSRISEAYEILANCDLCSHRCYVNRIAGELGKCKASSEARVFMAQTEVADELELIPTFAIAFSGCDLRCDFCNSGRNSWAPRSGKLFAAPEIAAEATLAFVRGARSVMILGGEPSIHAHAALEFVAEMPSTIPLIWKTNGNATGRLRTLIDGLFDYWVVDYKFGNNQCAYRIAKAANYLNILQENLHWAFNHSELIVRHLLMPGHLECCWKPVAQWIHDQIPDAKVNLGRGFWPGWKSHRHSELTRPLDEGEYQKALRIAHALRINLVQ